jgi:hypothetical protein
VENNQPVGLQAAGFFIVMDRLPASEAFLTPPATVARLQASFNAAGLVPLASITYTSIYCLAAILAGLGRGI